jgi:hypothetical protein
LWIAVASPAVGGGVAGRFQRSPMMIDGEETFEGLRDALNETPKLRAMLRKLVT